MSLERVLGVSILFFGALHVISIFFVQGTPLVSHPYDPVEYRVLAHNISIGHGFSASREEPYQEQLVRLPAYPSFLSMIEGIVPVEIGAQVVQQGMLFFAAFLLYASVLTITKRRNIALCAALFVLIEPQTWVLSLNTMTETVGLLFIACIVWVLVHRPLDVKTGFIVGIMLGLLSLMRTVGLLIAGAVLIPTIVRHKFFIVASLVLVFILSPWIVRNAYLVGEPILSSASAVNTILMLGSDAEKTMLLERQGGEFVAYTAPAYKAVALQSSDLLRAVGLFHVGFMQVACAPRVWFNHQYPLYVKSLLPGIGERALYMTSIIQNLVWMGIFFLVILGLYQGFATGHTILTMVCGLIVFVTLIANACIGDGRMIAGILPLVVVLGASGASFLAGMRFGRSGV